LRWAGSLLLAACTGREASAPLVVDPAVLVGAPACVAGEPAETAGALTLRVAHGAGVSPRQAVAAAEAAAVVWRDLGLTVRVRPPVSAPIAAPFDAAGAGPAIAVVAENSVPVEEGVVVFVAVGGIFGGPAPVGWGVHAAGWTVRPDTAPSGFPAAFSPTVFVDVVTPRRPGDLPLTGAHEVGHALGLDHRAGGEGALMRPGRDGQTCRPGISAAEAAVVAAAFR
jgi:hypothetical protein